MGARLKQGLAPDFVQHALRLGKTAYAVQGGLFIAVGITTLMLAIWAAAAGFRPQFFAESPQSSLLFFWLSLGPGWLAWAWARFRARI